MKRIALSLSLLYLFAAPTWAGDATVGSTPRTDSFRFDLETGLATLREWMSTADRLLKEHVDLQGDLHSGRTDDERSGRLRFRFYPKGRSQSDEAVEAETWFKSHDGQFSFQFKFREPEARTPVPENIL